ncbi:Dual specificity protein phosphatase 3 [Sarcoptes scabiei]|uniref:protein-serine/threonine phosphatase n=1 Tax=Sarcoptes scabiei TaxID=52283 RepID=A0A834VD64_SARSC|nr:Dual specificity protein phosphatase 3 [Sarcoptes scabiei]UXI19219.1 sodium/hydrogen exchanger 8 [Sarcoptes scabiei]
MFWRQQSILSSPSVTPNELLEILLAHTYGYYVLPSEPYDEVYPNIFLGDSTTALCIHLLKRIGITHVLNTAWGRHRNLGMVNTSEVFYRNAQIEFFGIEALDMAVYPLYQHFQDAANFIEHALSQPSGKVLVHCGEGISRSSSCVIAYLMIKQHLDVKEAISLVVKKRNILPNQGFLLQLCQLNDELFHREKFEQMEHRKLRQQSEPPPPLMMIMTTPKMAMINDAKLPPKSPPTPGCEDLERSSFHSRKSSIESFQNNNHQQPKQHGSSRSPTPTSTVTSPSFGRYYPQHGYSYSSVFNTTPKRDYIQRKPMVENRMLKQPTRSSLCHYSFQSPHQSNNRIQSYHQRAKSVERPSYMTRGSSYFFPSRSLEYRRYQSPLNSERNFNSSLMTTYLVNRPLPAISR